MLIPDPRGLNSFMHIHFPRKCWLTTDLLRIWMWDLRTSIWIVGESKLWELTIVLCTVHFNIKSWHSFFCAVADCCALQLRQRLQPRDHDITPVWSWTSQWNYPIKEGLDQNTSDCEANTAVPTLNVQSLGEQISQFLVAFFGGLPASLVLFQTAGTKEASEFSNEELSILEMHTL